MKIKYRQYGEEEWHETNGIIVNGTIGDTYTNGVNGLDLGGAEWAEQKVKFIEQNDTIDTITLSYEDEEGNMIEECEFEIIND